MDAATAVGDGWELLRRGAWAQARDRFEAARRESPSAEDLEGLAWACFWLLDVEGLLGARSEAHRRYLDRGDRRGAARTAMWHASEHLEFTGDVAVARGWFQRARRLLDGVPPSPEHGWLALHEGEDALLGAHDTTRARELAAQAAALGRRFDDRELEAVGLAQEGLAVVTEGRVDEGMALLDEAAAAALTGGFRELWAIAWASCYLIEACERARDLGRAAQWCREVEAVAARLGIDFAWAWCRARHAGVLVWSGRWPEAEAVLDDAARRLARQRAPWEVDATVRLAELRRRQGRLVAAEELYARAEGHPMAVLGTAEVALTRGDPARARRIAERALAAVPPRARAERFDALDVVVRARAALGDTDSAAEALAELEGVAAAMGTPLVVAVAAFGAGVVAAARGDAETARRHFEDAVDGFRQAGAPFDTARARLALADACVTLGAAGEAGEHRSRAHDELRRLGVGSVPSAGRASRNGSGALTRREREVLALIAQGLSDRQMAEALTISEHTVHRHVANILTKFGCPSRAAAVARGVATGLVDPLPG